MPFEYKLVRLCIDHDAESRMTALGARGWRLAGMDGGYAIFSRRPPSAIDLDVPRVDPDRCEIEKSARG